MLQPVHALHFSYKPWGKNVFIGGCLVPDMLQGQPLDTVNFIIICVKRSIITI